MGGMMGHQEAAHMAAAAVDQAPRDPRHSVNNLPNSITGRPNSMTSTRTDTATVMTDMVTGMVTTRVMADSTTI